jgi:hypothetical protein
MPSTCVPFRRNESHPFERIESCKSSFGGTDAHVVLLNPIGSNVPMLVHYLIGRVWICRCGIVFHFSLNLLQCDEYNYYVILETSIGLVHIVVDSARNGKLSHNGKSIPSQSNKAPSTIGGDVSPPMVDGALFDWEGMDLPLWDSFPFLAESTTM